MWMRKARLSAIAVGFAAKADEYLIHYSQVVSFIRRTRFSDARFFPLEGNQSLALAEAV
jgi:hypothetical protein